MYNIRMIQVYHSDF